MFKEKKIRLDNCVMNYVVKTSQPLSIVENGHFKSLINQLNPRYKLPSRKTLTTTLIPDQVNILNLDLKKNLNVK